jgi:hypothetical protein
MLPQFYRIIVFNSSGQTVTFNSNGLFNLKVTEWYIDPDTGKITYNQRGDDDMSFIAASACADGAEVKSDEIDNTANKYIGAEVQLEVLHDEGTAADGTFDIYLDGGDATGELASDADGYGTAEAAKLEPIGSLTWDPNGLDDETMRSSVFCI